MMMDSYLSNRFSRNYLNLCEMIRRRVVCGLDSVRVHIEEVLIASQFGGMFKRQVFMTEPGVS